MGHAMSEKLYGGLTKAQLRAMLGLLPLGNWIAIDGDAVVYRNRGDGNMEMVLKIDPQQAMTPLDVWRLSRTIAAARDALPDLLAEVERLEARLAAIEAQSAEEERETLARFCRVAK